MKGAQLAFALAVWAMVAVVVALLAGVPPYRVVTVAVQIGLWVGVPALVLWAVRDDDRAHDEQARR